MIMLDRLGHPEGKGEGGDPRDIWGGVGWFRYSTLLHGGSGVYASAIEVMRTTDGFPLSTGCMTCTV